MKPLTKKQRKFSITILGLVFVIFAPLIVLYSFGYRLDDGLTFQKTGGIFIHSNIPNAAVFLENEYVKNNGLFLRNILIQDLVPNKSYVVRFEKEGFQSWVKELFIYPSIVSEGRVLMLPQEYLVREILPYIDADGVATATATAPTRQTRLSNQEYVTVSELFATTTKATTTKPAVALVATTATPTIPLEKTKLEVFFESVGVEDESKLKNLIISGKEISWLTSEGIVLHWIDEKTTAPYYYCGGLERECASALSLEWGDIKQFDYFPGRSDVWIVLTSGGVYAVEIDDRSQRNIQVIYEGSISEFKLMQGGRLIMREGSRFFEINL